MSAATPAFIPPDLIRARFCHALSDMYRDEVPLYGDLVSLVDEINETGSSLANDDDDDDDQDPVNDHGSSDVGDNDERRRAKADRIQVERHGAIRVGKPSELRMLARLFRLMGMVPVGYYDLSTSGLPVHATAFRPVSDSSLARNPFRIFTSLLRLDLIPVSLRGTISSVLDARDIFHPKLPGLVIKGEEQGGLDADDAWSLVQHALHTFRWHEESLVDPQTYDRLKACHPLVADIVGFKGPHINHLTPRVVDIDRAQAGMEARGITPKTLIEGPPKRRCPILLRQTSFKAISERIRFKHTGSVSGHRARFGEIESRGVALTPKGHALYTSLMETAARRSREINPTNEAHQALLTEVFRAFPDDWETLRSEGLAYFEYTLAPDADAVTRKGTSASRSTSRSSSLEELVRSGAVDFSPITYEDFLPASAAGIFQSNLDENGRSNGNQESNGEADFNAHAHAHAHAARKEFEAALGGEVRDFMELYRAQERTSIEKVLAAM